MLWLLLCCHSSSFKWCDVAFSFTYAVYFSAILQCCRKYCVRQTLDDLLLYISSTLFYLLTCWGKHHELSIVIKAWFSACSPGKGKTIKASLLSSICAKISCACLWRCQASRGCKRLPDSQILQTHLHQLLLLCQALRLQANLCRLTLQASGFSLFKKLVH